MDLLGGYNSDSDSDESDAAPVTVTAKPTPITKLPPPKSESKADKKKRVMGKKLLKLSSVLPEHILNQLQQTGGGKSKANENDDDDSDSSSDEDEPSPRKTTPKAAAAPSRDYSKDEGIMGLLSALSKSNTSSRKPTNFLGNTEVFSSSAQSDEDPSTSIPSPEPEKPKATKSEPLGAAFLTTTVETVVRKKKEPAVVRSIHGDSTSQSAASVHVPKPSVPRPTSRIAPPQPRVQTASSLRSAAPAVRHPYPMHAPVASRQPTSYESTPYQYSQQAQRGQQQQPKTKKKQLSRKRQMEQMLRAGKLDQVEGDTQLSGSAHVYTMDADALPAAQSTTSSAGVRVVPTGSYDPSLGATSMSTDVTSRQKNTNQLNSLLANAASLESHRAQNPQYHLGIAKKAGSQRASAKRKYGW